MDHRVDMLPFATCYIIGTKKTSNKTTLLDITTTKTSEGLLHRYTIFRSLCGVSFASRGYSWRFLVAVRR